MKLGKKTCPTSRERKVRRICFILEIPSSEFGDIVSLVHDEREEVSGERNFDNVIRVFITSIYRREKRESSYREEEGILEIGRKRDKESLSSDLLLEITRLLRAILAMLLPPVISRVEKLCRRSLSRFRFERFVVKISILLKRK